MKLHAELAESLLDFPSDYDEADRIEAIDEAKVHALLVIAERLEHIGDALDVLTTHIVNK